MINPDTDKTINPDPNSQQKLYLGGKAPKRMVKLGQKQNKNPSIVDKEYNILSRLGEGAYGEVLLVEKKSTKQRYALKKINQIFIQKQCKAYQIFAERDILIMFKDERICKLEASFRDSISFYFLLQYCPGGDLASYLKLYNRMDLEEARFYAAQIVDILGVLQEKKVAHRDIKPENFMIDGKGNLILIDFGTAKIYEANDINRKHYEAFQKVVLKYKTDIDNEERERAQSFVGTALFASPEMLETGGSGFESDYWSLGVIIFKMYFGVLPFQENQEFLLFNKILQEEIVFPSNVSYRFF